MIGLSSDKDLIGPWVFHRIQKTWGPEGREVIGLVKDDEVLAGVVFEDYTGAAMAVHIAVSHENVPLRKFLIAVADYAFNQMAVDKLIGLVPSTNTPALGFDLRLGFKPEAVIKGVYPDGDLVILSLTKEDCRFLPRKRAA